jgi:hypothetical protein
LSGDLTHCLSEFGIRRPERNSHALASSCVVSAFPLQTKARTTPELHRKHAQSAVSPTRVIEVVSSAIIASGKVDKILPDIWKIAFAGNGAQLVGNFSVVVAVLKAMHFAPLSHRQAGALASSQPAL